MPHFDQSKIAQFDANMRKIDKLERNALTDSEESSEGSGSEEEREQIVDQKHLGSLNIDVN